MRPIVPVFYYIGRFTGLCPFTWVDEKTIYKIKIVPLTSFELIKNGLIISGLVSGVAYHFFGFSGALSLYHSMEVLSLLLSTILPVMSILLIWLNKTMLVKALDSLDEVEGVVKGLGENVSYRAVGLLQYVLLGSMVWAIVLDISQESFLEISLINKGFYLIGIHFPYELMLIVIGQFTEWILDIRQQFIAINNLLDKWAADPTDITHSTNSTKRIQVLPANPDFMQQNNDGIFTNMRQNDEFARVTMLRTIRKAHYKLCDAARIINDVYTWQIFICIAKLFNFNIYQLYSIYKDPSSAGVVWVFLNVCDLVFITISCALCQNESEKTAQILHKSKRQSDNHQLNDTIELFSLQMLHQKVVLTAYGFFPLDCSLLFSIVAATTTYIVILIQFDTSNISST